MHNANVLIRAQGPYTPMSGPKAYYWVTILAHMDFRRDLDNLSKPLLDALSRSGVVPNDRWAVDVHLRRDTEKRLAKGLVRLSWGIFRKGGE